MKALGWKYMVVLLPSILGCGETTYDLYEQVDPGLGPSSGGALVSATGGATNQMGPTGGSDGIGGDNTPDVPAECQASRDPSLTLVRLLSTSSNLCVTQGAATTFLESPGYEIMLSSCLEGPSQYWTVRGLSDGSWELRNEGSAMNLDINYSNTADGTPVVLFTPHRLENQRFFILPGSGDSFLLAPDNAPWQCVEVRDDSLEIWPCDAQNLAQNFQQISCLGQP